MNVTTAHPQLIRRSPVLALAKTAPGALYLLALMAITLTIWTPGFSTAANLTNVTLQVSVLTIVALGLLNGTLIAVAGMPPFIVTLGTFGIAQSVATVLTRGDSVVGLPDYYRWFNDGVFAGIPVP